MSVNSVDYFKALPSIKIDKQTLQKIYKELKIFENYSEWNIKSYRVSYGSMQLKRRHIKSLDLHLPLPISSAHMVTRGPNTFYYPHKDRNNREFTLIYNFSDDRSPLVWYKNQSFSIPIIETDLNVPTLINTQKDFHGISELSSHKRITLQLNFDSFNYKDALSCLFHLYTEGKKQ